MQSMIRHLAVAAAMSLCAPFASAAVLNFDDIVGPDGFAAVPGNYGGLDWSASGLNVFTAQSAPFTPRSGMGQVTTDWIDGGVSVEDSVIYARELKALGYDVVHCSSGGFDGAKVPVAPLYQAPLSAAVRKGAGIATAAVGLITKPEEAEQILAQGEADLIGLARQALDDPNWALHALRGLDGGDTYGAWPQQSGYAVRNKDKALGRLT